jgi:hypothetical protein
MKIEHYGAIETIGSITKMENLCSMDQKVLENSLVLRNIDPFPGFQTQKGLKETAQKPNSIFIILRYQYAPEKINEVNKGLINSKITNCYPSFGEIITRDSILPCIRIKALEDIDFLVVIQEFLLRNNVLLMPYRKIQGNAIIKIFKSFRMIEIDEGLYRDLNEGAKIYIRIAHSLRWKQFTKITNKIKANLTESNFDSALGIIYRFCGPEDIIRIYDENKTLDRALSLKKLYVKEIKNIITVSANQDFHDI